jgi:hypothetical protein
MCISVWINREAVLAFVPFRINERLHSANLFVHGTCGVLNHRTMSYRVPYKIGFAKRLKVREWAATEDFSD